MSIMPIERRKLGRRSAVWLLKAAVIVAIAVVAALSPGFLTVAGAIATLDHAALIGLLGLGMTFITISGNQLSLSLGATLSAAAIAFVATTGLGTVGAAAAAFATAVMIQAGQGFVIGYFGANPIIVSIAGLGLILGIGTHVTGGGEVYPVAGQAMAPFQGGLGPLNMMILFFLIGGLAAELLLVRSRFGRELIAIGSSTRAAAASGIRVPTVVMATYAVAGVFCALAGELSG